jgi:aldehyde dehydrogenase
VLTGGERAELAGELEGGYYVQPTVFRGHNRMRVFQEEIFGPVVSVTSFKDDDALAIANDTLYGLGAGVWTRDMATRPTASGREIKAGRVWTNCYHAVPGPRRVRWLQAVGHRARDPQAMMLDHYQQTKNLLVSYSPKALGFF